MLRYREDLDIDSLKSKYTNLVVVRHKLSKVSPNGLPEADYNEKLFALDDGLRTLFELSLHGAPVIIETFGGKRNYYIYADLKENASDLIESLKRAFPNEHLSWTIHSDAEWDFFTKYSNEFFG